MLSSSCLTPHILFLVEEWNWNVTNQRRSDGWKEQACRCDQTSWLELSKCQVTFPYDAIVLLQPPMSFKRAHTEKLLGGNEPLKSFWPCPMFSVSPHGLLPDLYTHGKTNICAALQKCVSFSPTQWPSPHRKNGMDKAPLATHSVRLQKNKWTVNGLHWEKHLKHSA